VFSRRYACHVRQRMDVARMLEAASALKGQHHFKSFESSGSRRVSTVRTIQYQIAMSGQAPSTVARATQV